MDFKDKALCKIRTITTFLSLTNDRRKWKEKITLAQQLCDELSQNLSTQGYTVQTIRIVTNPFGEYLNTDNLSTAKNDLAYLSQLLDYSGTSTPRIRFAIGEAKTHHEISLLPELIKEYGDLCNVCVNVELDDSGILDNSLIEESAKAVIKKSQMTPRGEGNFNFTVNFNCKPLIPYFPASYHSSKLKDSFVVGLETPDLLVHTLKDINQNTNAQGHNERFKVYFEGLSSALQYHISKINTIIQKLPSPQFTFSGFDSSAAPSKDCSSLAEVYQLMGVEYFGASGTVEASSLLTRVFKSIKGVQLVGFSGLMLALTEDMGLAEGTQNSNFDIRSLLTYSAVCGIGLDTVPIPGDTSLDKMSALMRDTGTMAYRLNKPLTVRLFPIPTLKAGDMTTFQSADLCNCTVLNVP